MNLAQSKCKLPESESLDLFIKSCANEAHGIVQALVDETSSPTEIYHKGISIHQKSGTNYAIFESECYDNFKSDSSFQSVQTPDIKRFIFIQEFFR